MNKIVYICNYLRGGVFKLISLSKKLAAKHVVFGRHVTIYPSATLRLRHKNCHIVFGNDVVFGCDYRNYSVVTPTKARIITRLDNAELIVGDRSNIFGANICIASRITIGNDCQIACGVNILDYNGHQSRKAPRGSEIDTPEPITIGNNVWIGTNVVILKGTVIGDNSIIGAGSVVKGIYPANSLIMGNPAEVVKDLNM